MSAYVESMSNKYPAKNRAVRDGLGSVDMLIEGSMGMVSFTPNSLAIALMSGSLTFPGAPIEPSDISGLPGYLFCTSEISLSLTVGELVRFAGHALSPGEFFILAEKFGIVHETHGDFYSEETGRAIQPSIGPLIEESFAYKCMFGTESPDCINDWIDRWHETAPTGLGLIEYLGFTVAEYGEWVLHPQRLYKILFEKLRDFPKP